MSETGRESFPDYLRRLEALGFRPSSTRGQNFLLDPTLHRVIAEASGAGPNDVVLEIGVGLGFLTRELAPRVGAVVGVEIDERLFAIAGEDLAASANVQLVLADALGGPGGSLPPSVVEAVEHALVGRDRLFVVGNLPYAASGPLLAELTARERLPDGITALVQKELGDRLAAGVDQDDYGGLSALLQSVYTVERLRTVGTEVFRPRPKVASAIVRLRLRPDAARLSATERRALQVFLRTLFGKRRKVLRTTLAEAANAIHRSVPPLPAELLARRAETLAPDELVALFRATHASAPGST